MEAPEGCVVMNIKLHPSDPLFEVILKSKGPIKTRDLELDSTILSTLKTNGIDTLEPYWADGQLLGVICQSHQEAAYSEDQIVCASPTIHQPEYRLLKRFTVASQPGNEISAIEQVTTAINPLNPSRRQAERIKTAVGETTMNAMEHGNHYQPDKPVLVEVLVSETELVLLITDFGGQNEIMPGEQPDLDAKLAGLQSPRGWGLFLIENMVDRMKVFTDGTFHTVELVLRLKPEGEA